MPAIISRMNKTKRKFDLNLIEAFIREFEEEKSPKKKTIENWCNLIWNQTKVSVKRLKQAVEPNLFSSFPSPNQISLADCERLLQPFDSKFIFFPLLFLSGVSLHRILQIVCQHVRFTGYRLGRVH